jgi:lantibiotic modifying enzyme
VRVTGIQLTAIHETAATLSERYGHVLSGDKPLDKLPLNLIWQWDQVLGGDERSGLSPRLELLKYAHKEMNSIHRRFQREQHGLSGWIECFRSILKRYPVKPVSPDYIRGHKPVPFEHLLYPFVDRALQTVRKSCTIPPSISERAIADYAHHLLAQLSRNSSACFYKEFNAFRKTQYAAYGSKYKDIYQQYVRDQSEGGIISFFEKYSALARLLTTITNQWAESTILFIKRLTGDQLKINHTFFNDSSPGQLVRIRSGLTARHSKDGETLELIYSSGKRLLYKPRSAAADIALTEIVAWLNSVSRDLLSLRAVPVLDMGVYSWHAYVPYRSCKRQEEVRQYYLRAGQIAGLLQCLGSMDYHFGNVRAYEGYPMLLDNETLFSPLLNVHAETVEGGKGYDADLYALSRSLFLVDGRHLRNTQVPPIRGVFDSRDRYRTERYDHINTDAMQRRIVYASRTGKNFPKLGGVKCHPADYLEEIRTGFKNALQCLYRHRLEFSNVVRGSTNDFNLILRMLLRPSAYYTGLMVDSLVPDRLRDGLERSLLFESLARLYVTRLSTAEGGALLWAEQQMIEQTLIPWFHLRADQRFYLEPPLTKDMKPLIKLSAAEVFEQNMNRLSPAYIRQTLKILTRYFERIG